MLSAKDIASISRFSQILQTESYKAWSTKPLNISMGRLWIDHWRISSTIRACLEEDKRQVTISKTYENGHKETLSKCVVEKLRKAEEDFFYNSATFAGACFATLM